MLPNTDLTKNELPKAEAGDSPDFYCAMTASLCLVTPGVPDIEFAVVVEFAE